MSWTTVSVLAAIGVAVAIVALVRPITQLLAAQRASYWDRAFVRSFTLTVATLYATAIECEFEHMIAILSGAFVMFAAIMGGHAVFRRTAAPVPIARTRT